MYYTLREPLQLAKHVQITFDVELILLVCPRAGQESSVYVFLSCVCLCRCHLHACLHFVDCIQLHRRLQHELNIYSPFWQHRSANTRAWVSVAIYSQMFAHQLDNVHVNAGMQNKTKVSSVEQCSTNQVKNMIWQDTNRNACTMLKTNSETASHCNSMQMPLMQAVIYAQEDWGHLFLTMLCYEQHDYQSELDWGLLPC